MECNLLLCLLCLQQSYTRCSGNVFSIMKGASETYGSQEGTELKWHMDTGRQTHTHTHTHRDTNTYTYPGTHTENYTQKQKHSDTNTHTHTAHLGHFFSNKKVLDDCPKDPQWLSDLVSDLFCTFDGPRSQHWWSCPVIPLCPRGLFSYSNWEIPPEHWWVWLPARPK